jgi:hypothetical protein
MMAPEISNVRHGRPPEYIRRPSIIPHLSCARCDAFEQTKLSPISGKCVRRDLMVWGGSRCDDFKVRKG